MNLQLLGIVALLCGLGYFIVTGQIDARMAAEVTAASERTRADLNEKQLERVTEALEKNRARQAELQTELQEARDLEATTTAVVQDRQRLQRLTDAKPGLLEIKARKATTAVWSTIEEESRD